MNGRCETDPLDFAVDVCDRCYGEFCDTHLVRPKGRRHPFCSNCAIAASGVRGSSKLDLLGSRKTAKKRRAALKAKPDGEEQVFKFFELEEDTQQTAVAESEAEVEPEDGAVTTFDEPAEAQVEEAERSADNEVPATPAMAKLQELRRGADAETSDPASDEAEPEPQASQEAQDSPATAGASPPPQPAETATRPKTPPPPERAPRTGAPVIAEPPSTPAPTAEPSAVPSQIPKPQPRRSPKPAAASSQPGDLEQTSDDPASDEPVERLGQQNPENRAPGALPLPSRQSQLSEDQRNAVPVDAPSGSEEAGGDELTDSVQPQPTHRRKTAPMIGEIKNVAGRRADDVQAPKPLAAATAATASPSTDSRNAIEQFDATRPPAELKAQAPAETDSPARADTDENGNWIPPILRGFAPDAAEAKADLPKRRNSD